MATVSSGSTGTEVRPVAEQSLPTGTRLHEFEITRVIGDGGFSIVYLTFDHSLQRSVAVKEYLPSSLASRVGSETVGVRSDQHQHTFEAGLRSFINEARLLAQFDDPALVKVHRFWEANGTAYMAMPYYEGRTLKRLLKEQPDLVTQSWLKDLFAPVLSALDLLHQHRCYHRDVSPDNILVQAGGAPVLLDFGAARRSIGDMTQAFTVILKPGYAPVEQYASEGDLKQGPWTDVYAVSAVLYWAITGTPPTVSVARMIKDSLEPLSRRSLPGYDRSFLAAIDHGLSVRPEDRPQSIAELRDLLGIHGALATRSGAQIPLPPRETSTAPQAAAVPAKLERESSVREPFSTAAVAEDVHKPADKTTPAPINASVPLALRRTLFVSMAVLGVVVVAVGVAAMIHLSGQAARLPSVAPPPVNTDASSLPPNQAPVSADPPVPTAPATASSDSPSLPDLPPMKDHAPDPPRSSTSQASDSAPPAARSGEPVAPTARPKASAGRSQGKSAEESTSPPVPSRPREAKGDKPAATGAPSPEQCRDWQRRVTIGELLTRQESDLFNNRCPLL